MNQGAHKSGRASRSRAKSKRNEDTAVTAAAAAAATVAVANEDAMDREEDQPAAENGSKGGGAAENTNGDDDVDEDSEDAAEQSKLTRVDPLATVSKHTRRCCIYQNVLEDAALRAPVDAHHAPRTKDATVLTHERQASPSFAYRSNTCAFSMVLRLLNRRSRRRRHF